jgi:hypothetical protein
VLYSGLSKSIHFCSQAIRSSELVYSRITKEKLLKPYLERALTTYKLVRAKRYQG